MTPADLVILTPDPEDDARYDDWREQATAIAALTPGIATRYQPWSAPIRDAALVLPLMAWGYHRHPEQWAAALDDWQATRLRVANPVEVLRWNSDKGYLLDLARRGVAVVPTLDIACLDAAALDLARAEFGRDIVIKPPVSAGSDATYRLSEDDAVPAAVEGARMIAQPLIRAILDEGELSLFYLGGTLAHAIVKHARSGDFRVQPQFGGEASPVAPPPAAVACAEAAIAACDDDLLYARVDLVADGAIYRLMEIELIEPWLYLDQAADGGAGFAGAIAALLVWP